VANTWGQYTDPDTERGISQYERTGLRLRVPSDIQNMDLPELRCVARACSDLLDSTYKGHYPQSTKDSDALATSISQGETRMFMLLAGEAIIAIASLVHRRNSMRGNLNFVELSKAAKLQGDLAASTSVRHLSKYRLPWAMSNLPEVDFLYGSPRAASKGRDGAPGGRQAQSVWWGGRRHGINLPLLATNVGWNFRVGGIEPLTGFVVPTNAAKWASAVSELKVSMPDETVKQAINTLFVEGTGGFVTPQFVVAPGTHDEPFTFREARPPSADIVTKYYVSEQAEHLTERSIAEADEHLRSAISQKVIIESDIAASPRGAQIMRHLLAQGWAIAGWQPSEIVYGGICPVLARVNPFQLSELIQPVHYSQYFDQGGLGRTRQVLDAMYRTMYNNASDRIDANPTYLRK
jgi:hypothetical protein